MRPVSVSSFVSSLRSARSRLAGALALTVALLSMMLASPAALAASGTVIKSFGSTSLVQVGNNFYFYPVGGSSGPLLKVRRLPCCSGSVRAWAPIGAEQTASGYNVAWKAAGADQYAVWSTDSNGNFITNFTGTVSGNSAALKSLETTFHQDLNGDGVIGVVTTVIEAFGSTSLTKIGDTFYLKAGGSGRC